MKRLHIHISVANLEQSISFYTDLFGAEPSKSKDDYAKWMLEDPKVNFAISTRGTKEGLDHLGIQAEDSNDLEEIRQRLESADRNLFDQGVTECCYSRSDKTWVKDPSGIAWEAYETMSDVETFSQTKASSEETCCAPKTEKAPPCC